MSIGTEIAFITDELRGYINQPALDEAIEEVNDHLLALFDSKLDKLLAELPKDAGYHGDSSQWAGGYLNALKEYKTIIERFKEELK